MQSKMLNIPSYIDDPSYRYKMPSLQLKIEGRGNGIKTKIVNLNEVATHLRVPSAYPLKFLGYEVGSATNESQSVMNGSFTEPELRKHLDKFIEKYVLCSNCSYPEMILKIKHGKAGGACNSCGTRSVLDNTHKFATYIIKNPPKNASEFSGDKKPVDGKETKGDKKDDVKKPGKHGEKSAHEAKPQEGKTAEKQETDKKEEEKNDEKVKESATQSVTVTFKDLEEDLIAQVRQVYLHYSYVENFGDNPEAVNKILSEAKEIVPEEHANKIPYILFNAIFDVNIAKEVEKNQAILAQAYQQIWSWEPELDILLNLEKFLLVRNNSFVFEKYVPTILKLFYDEDLVTENCLLDWEQGKLNSKLIMDFRYQKSVDEKFKAAALPILKWLREEQDGEREENGNESGKEDDDDSDIDIDNI